ncbi:TetR/AcrR family transcriptional regulator [Pseudonocardia phyllosphaerae]|uniref:TetR/AcrR family transcriptional regulator n=1 Tax=Pseudonocardia phyllosphaerae TaxID=3390502 RepID=UPI00397C3C08
MPAAGPPSEPAPAPDDGGATRRALLTAAAELFAEQGYDRTTVRAIAERAGVNQALLFRHFGNKEAVFARVAAERALAVLHAGPSGELLARTLGSILTERSGPENDLFDSVLRSAGSTEALRVARDELAHAFTAAFAAQAAGEPSDAALRAELLLGWLLGINLLRNVLHTDAVSGADPAAVDAHVTRAATALLTG